MYLVMQQNDQLFVTIFFQYDKASNESSYVLFCLFLCTQKNEYTIESVSVAVRPAVRLHDNFRKETLIDLKFSAEFSRINISVEFEDGPDPSKIS